MSGAAQVGLALAPEWLCATVAGRRGVEPAVWRRALAPYDPEAGAWDELGAALAALAGELGVRPGVAHLALLPPAVQVRRVELPRLPEADLRRILSRDAARFFPGAHEPQLVGLAPLPGGQAPPHPWLVATAAAGWVEAVRAEVERAGWRLAGIVPAQAAWAAAAGELWPHTNGAPGTWPSPSRSGWR